MSSTKTTPRFVRERVESLDAFMTRGNDGVWALCVMAKNEGGPLMAPWVLTPLHTTEQARPYAALPVVVLNEMGWFALNEAYDTTPFEEFVMAVLQG